MRALARWLAVPSALYVFLFVAGRGRLFLAGYTAAHERYVHNAAFRAACTREEFRRQLGHYVDKCEEELRAVLVSPLWHGLEHAYEHTYLCGGDAPCHVVLTDAARNPYTVVGIVLLLLLFPYVRNLYLLSNRAANALLLSPAQLHAGSHALSLPPFSVEGDMENAWETSWPPPHGPFANGDDTTKKRR